MPEVAARKLTIAVKSKKGRKTRSFSISLLASVIVPEDAWSAASGTGHRPAFVAYAGSEQECRAFTANFRGGAPAKRFARETLADAMYAAKKGDLRWIQRKLSGSTRGRLVLAYVPALFHRESDRSDDAISFVLMPPLAWVSHQSEKLASRMGDQAERTALAVLFAAFLDERSCVPMLQDIRFHLQLLEAAYRDGLLIEPSSKSGFDAWGVASIGLHRPLLFYCKQEQLDQLIASETTQYFEQGLHDTAAAFRPNVNDAASHCSGRSVQPCLPFAA